MKIANFKNKKKELFTKQQQESYENAKICKDQFGNKYLKNKKDRKLENIVIIQGNMEMLCIANVIKISCA